MIRRGSDKADVGHFYIWFDDKIVILTSYL